MPRPRHHGDGAPNPWDRLNRASAATSAQSSDSASATEPASCAGRFLRNCQTRSSREGMGIAGSGQMPPGIQRGPTIGLVDRLDENPAAKPARDFGVDQVGDVQLLGGEPAARRSVVEQARTAAEPSTTITGWFVRRPDPRRCGPERGRGQKASPTVWVVRTTGHLGEFAPRDRADLGSRRGRPAVPDTAAPTPGPAKIASPLSPFASKFASVQHAQRWLGLRTSCVAGSDGVRCAGRRT
jgi:hypothetical protein